MKRALITGISGQDGSYLAEYLLEKGYEVHGIVRRVALEAPRERLSRIYSIRARLHLHTGALENYASLFNIIARVRPEEIYHLGAQSFVSASFEDGFSTCQTNIDGTHYMLSAARELVPDCRFYFAGSSEMFGNTTESPQSETSPLLPRSAYGISKVAGFHFARNYREAYGMHVCTGILYNHESPRRGMEFVTRKITHQAARIRCGLDREIRLGNLDAYRDWGHAREYVKAMWRMLQHDTPDDFVIATGVKHSVREFLYAACAVAGIDPEGSVVIDRELLRPAEVDILQGDASKAKRVLGWSYDLAFEDLVREMVESDIDLVSQMTGVSRPVGLRSMQAAAS
jgi:GDPmannose 4,6-dehydratase